MSPIRVDCGRCCRGPPAVPSTLNLQCRLRSSSSSISAEDVYMIYTLSSTSMCSKKRGMSFSRDRCIDSRVGEIEVARGGPTNPFHRASITTWQTSNLIEIRHVQTLHFIFSVESFRARVACLCLCLLRLHHSQTAPSNVLPLSPSVFKTKWTLLDRQRTPSRPVT